MALNGKWGFNDSTLKEVVSPRYDDIQYFSGIYGYGLMQSNGKWGYVGTDGTEYWEGGYTAPQQKQQPSKKGQKK